MSASPDACPIPHWATAYARHLTAPGIRQGTAGLRVPRVLVRVLHCPSVTSPWCLTWREQRMPPWRAPVWVRIARPGRHSRRCRPAESNPSRRVCEKRVTTKRPAAASEKRRPPVWRCSWRSRSGRAALTSSGGGSERLILSLPHSLARYPRARCADGVLPARSAATRAAGESSGAQSVPGHSSGSGRRRKPGRSPHTGPCSPHQHGRRS